MGLWGMQKRKKERKAKVDEREGGIVDERRYKG